MLPYVLSEKSSQAVIGFYKEAISLAFGHDNVRETFREIDMSYLRTLDLTEEQFKAKYAAEIGDPTKFQNIIVPVVMPQVEEAVAFQQDVFLTGTPIFGSVAPPNHVDAAAQMDAILLDQQVRGNWVAELSKALRNGFKYNFGPTEVADTQEASYDLENLRNPRLRKEELNKKIIWRGNTIKSLDPYNTIYDPRVQYQDLATKGEFAGYTELYPRVSFKAFVAALPFRSNIKEALESKSPVTSDVTANEYSPYYIPDLDPCRSYSRDSGRYRYNGTDFSRWLSIANPKGAARFDYSSTYLVTTLYARILPEDFGITDVPGKGTPQIWKFIVVNGEVVIYSERLTNAHNFLPIVVCAPKDDGLGYQTKSLAEDVKDFQSITTALANSVIAARRRAISDRLLYDPLKISPSSIRSDSPVARIPVKLGPLGGTIRDAIFPIPFDDSQSQYAAQDINIFLGLADRVSGLNPARRGQFVKGNKSRFEFAETMSNSTSRDRSMAIALEGNFFRPIKQIIKSNILQFQGIESVFDVERQQLFEIDPVLLRRANIEFKLSDGLLPSDKLIDGETLTSAIQAISSSPELAASYNLAPMFSYLMNMRGAKLQNFEKSPEQLEYERAVQTWQQAVAALIDTLSKMESPPSPEELKNFLPPQPVPEDFNYTPGIPADSISPASSSVMEKYTNKVEEIKNARAQAGSQ